MTARSRAILTEQFGGHRSSPVDRARTGSKHHLLTDSGGIPLAISLTGGQRNDVTQLLPLVDGVGPVRGKAGRASAPSGCSPIAAMTTTSTAASSGSAASSR